MVVVMVVGVVGPDHSGLDRLVGCLLQPWPNGWDKDNVMELINIK